MNGIPSPQAPMHRVVKCHARQQFLLRGRFHQHEQAARARLGYQPRFQHLLVQTHDAAVPARGHSSITGRPW